MYVPIVKASMDPESPSKAVNTRVVHGRPISMRRFSENRGPSAIFPAIAVTIPPLSRT